MEFETAFSTGVNCEKRKINWKIENWELISKSEDLISSQKIEFCAGETIGLETKWLCSLRSINERIIEFHIGVIGVRGEALANNQVIGSVNANITMETGEGVLQPLVKDGMPSGVKNFLLKDWRFSYILEHLPLVNGCLLLEIQLTLYSPKLNFNGATVLKAVDGGLLVDLAFEQKFNVKLQDDMRKLLNSPCPSSNAETKIVSKDGKEFTVQRGILSVRSPVFETMFQSEMSENNTGIIRIDDLGSKTINVLLEFLYAGALHQDWTSDDVIVELVYAAGKYQLKDLLEFFDRALGTVCSKGNAGKLINLANKLDLKQAERDIFYLMKEDLNNMSELVTFCNDSTAATSM